MSPRPVTPPANDETSIPDPDGFEAAEGARLGEDALVVEIDGFEGPIDLLLTLARDQKVDLTKISILQLADQYLAFIERARRLKLEIAADYLVMAAWLAYLKSRILLPKPESEEESEDPAEMAARLAFQLQRLEAMQNIAKVLMERPRLGLDFFSRGMPEALKVERTPRFEIELYELLKAYGEIRGRQQAGGQLRILPTRLYSMEQALQRLRHIIGETTHWQTIESFLPPESQGEDQLLTRSALAGTFAAMLELTREGLAEVRQSGTFQPIYVRGARPRAVEGDGGGPAGERAADGLDDLGTDDIDALLDEETWDEAESDGPAAPDPTASDEEDR